MVIDTSGHEYNEDNLGSQEQDVVQERPVGALPRARLGHSLPLGLRLRFDISTHLLTLCFRGSDEYLNDICDRGTKRVRDSKRRDMQRYAQRIQTPTLVNIIAMEKRVMGKERCHTATLRSKLNIYADGCTCERTCGGHIDSTRVWSPHSRRSICIITTEEIQKKKEAIQEER